MKGRTVTDDATATAGIDWPALYATPVAGRDAARHAAAASPLARNGFAMLDDMETPLVRATLAELERYQMEFIAATRAVWTEDNAHTGDKLYNWSRRWEYPYCWWNLRDVTPGRILDAGAGISFFPYWLARHGWTVTAEDINPMLATRFTQANAALGAGVRFAVGPIEALPFPDASFDAVACVSVLEHAPQRTRAMEEFARVLAPGGRLVITWDVSLSRDSDVMLEDVALLLAGLGRHFDPVHPVDLMRPSNLMTTDRMLAGERWRLPWRPHRQWWRRAASWLRHGDPFHSLAVMGTTWRRR
jgi:SAM-dependent methyltransferase